MNIQTKAGIAVIAVSLFTPVPYALVPWFAGVALIGFGRGVASSMRSTRGGE